ncbi:hypothetical protein HX088_11345 [Empedobacter sp. 225-1]|uniref:hypothetical protein n=1 Tax=Empedobacter sp. 225-1 TaxID=2746725 RepID=UPI0025766DD1|nr:hypothetical protein [Empedobacter sp. 225-1]MDM1523861.1 hypothetical protein [Empedobacter sp. 225-1]
MNQNINSKTSSLIKKLKSITANGGAGLVESLTSTNVPSDIIDERTITCKGCPNFNDEPISMLRYTDTEDSSLNGKICGECGCIISLKIRQNKEICRFWKK